MTILQLISHIFSSHHIHGLHPGVPRVPLPEADAQHLRAVHHPAGHGVPERRPRRLPTLAPGQVMHVLISSTLASGFI